VDPLQTSFLAVTLNDLVLAFAEDPPGILWTGFAGNGMAKINLNKKDGSNITRYVVDPSIKDGKDGIGINFICPFERGMFMLATSKGVYFFNALSGIFTKAPYTQKNTAIY
jgi:hypothetical protein